MSTVQVEPRLATVDDLISTRPVEVLNARDYFLCTVSSVLRGRQVSLVDEPIEGELNGQGDVQFVNARVVEIEQIRLPSPGVLGKFRNYRQQSLEKG